MTDREPTKKVRPRHEHLYLRVIHRERARDEADVDAPVLIGLVEEFAAGSLRSHVRLLYPPSPHPKGGYTLHFDLKAGDKTSLVEFLHASGWAGVL